MGLHEPPLPLQHDVEQVDEVAEGEEVRAVARGNEAAEGRELAKEHLRGEERGRREGGGEGGREGGIG